MGNKTKKLFRYTLILLASSLLIWIVISISEWRVRNVAKSYEARSLQLLNDFKDAVNLDFLLSLEYSGDVFDHPHYVRIQRLVDAYHAYFPDLHLFSLLPADTGMIYGFHNIHGYDSLEGRTFKDVDNKAVEVFEKHIPLTFGPYEKNGEQVFTSLMPVSEPITGETKFLLGIDLLTRGYETELMKVRNSSISISVIAIGILLMSLAFLYWRNRQSIKIRSMFRHTETILIGLLGLLMTLMGVMVSNDLYMKEKRDRFELQSRQMTSLVRYELERIRENVRVAASYLDNSEEVTKDEFDEFTSVLFKNSSIMSMAWAERIDNPDRISSSNSEQDKPVFQFRNGIFEIKRVSYSTAENKSNWGFDPQEIGVHELEQACTNGLDNASSPMSIMENDAAARRINIYFPVLDRNAENTQDAPCRGFVLASLNIGRTLDMVLNELKWEGESASLGIIDMMPDAKPIILASFPRHHASISDEEHFEEHLSHFMFSNRNPIFVFGRAYAIISHTSHAFENSMSFIRSWMVALAGFVMTILLVWIVAGSKNKWIRLEFLVDERTKLLQERIKEITALKTINEIIHDTDDEIAVMSRIPLILNESLQHPEQSNVEIEFNKHHYQANFNAMVTPSVYETEIAFSGGNIGVIRGLTMVSGGFLPEEIELIKQSKLLIARWMEKRHAAEALRKSEELFSKLIESAYDSVYLMEDYHYTYVNQSFVKLTGYSSEELTSQSFTYMNLLSDQGKEVVAQRVKMREQGLEVPPQYSIQLITKSGYVRDVELSTVAIPQADKLVILGIMHDMTERIQAERALKNSEEELQQQNEELEVMNEELSESNRKIRQLNLDLVKAKEKAEAGDKLKTAFLNNISHEVRTPLNGILGGAALLGDLDPGDENRSELIEMIDISAHRLLRTITQYMDISMLSSNSMPVFHQQTNLYAALRPVVDRAKAASEAKKLKFTVVKDIDHDADYSAKTDPSLIGKVVEHLLDNAVKFTDEGEITLGFQCGSDHVNITVEDTGIGINPVVSDKIFSIFMQEDQSHIRRYDGSGLGLAICHKIAQLLGGNLNFESEKGKGTKVTFKFNVDCSEPRTPKPEVKAPKSIYSGQPEVLVAEDEDSNFAVLELLLKRKFNAQVHRAVNGLLATEYCQQYPDLAMVIMDIKMPVMDGFEATRLIKTIRPDLPVLGLTAYGLSGDERRVRDAGCDAYLAKPFKSAELISIIEGLLTGRSMRNL
jgi:PAS domain S-box-containing protein